jgi:hypothetical protein
MRAARAVRASADNAALAPADLGLRTRSVWQRPLLVQTGHADGLVGAAIEAGGSTKSARADAETAFLEVTVAFSNVADRKIRPQGPEVAMHVEDEHDVTVLCWFRPLDRVPVAPKHAR